MDAGHLPLFAALAFFFENNSMLSWRDRTVRVLGLVLFAIVVEITQPFFGRSESVTDLVNGVAGILFGWAFAVVRHRWRSRILFGCAIVAFLSTQLIFLLPAYSEWRAISFRRESFPRLGDFETAVELKLWRAPLDLINAGETVSIDTDQASHGHRALRVRRGNASVLAIEYQAGDMDWSNYESLKFDLFSPGGASTVHIRIDDHNDCTEFDARFNRALQLHPGWNSFTIPLETIATGPTARRLDLKHIRRIILFGTAEEPSEVFLDFVRLE